MKNIKRIICAFAFFIFYNMLTAQSLVWQKEYGTDQWDTFGGDVIETLDGGYIISGSPYFYFVKIDNKGDTIWTRQYSPEYGVNSCVFITQLSDSGYIAIGLGGDSCNQLQILKMNSKGDSLWNKSLGCNEYSNIINIKKTSDGGYIITCQNWTNIGYRAFLLKLDSAFNKEWENTDRGPLSTWAETTIQTKDGNYMIAGGNSLDTINTGVFLAKVKSNGDSIWTKTITGKGYTYGADIIETGNGDFMICGHTDSIGNKGAYLIKTDKDGNLKWEKTYGKTQYDGFNSLLSTSDGAYIAVGTRGYIYYPGPEIFHHGDIYLAKIDSDGNILQDKYYGGDWLDQGIKLKKTKDGGYILLGNTLSFVAVKYFHIYLLKLDSALNVFGAGINQQISNGNNSFKIFPNPTTNTFTILHDSQHKEELSIYNVIGDIVYKDYWLQGQMQKNIDMSELPSGIYIIKLGETLQKVVKE